MSSDTSDDSLPDWVAEHAVGLEQDRNIGLILLLADLRSTNRGICVAVSMASEPSYSSQ